MISWFVMLALAAEPTYAKPELLIDGPTLVKNTAKYRILDARPAKDYEKGHAPGALHVPVETWAKAMGNRPDEVVWAKTLGQLGLSADKPIVVVGLPRTVDAARVWWILRYWGFEQVRLLDGGQAAYVAAGGKLSTEAPKVEVTKPVLRQQAERLATKEQILEGLKKGDLGPLVDARSEGEYCGTDIKAKRGGAIPEAKNLEWTATLDKEGKFKSAAELQKLFQEVGIDPSKPTTTYCQSGGRAAVMAFALELMGGKPARNYYGSWSEWGNDAKTPIVSPKKEK
jgi:thiosulfate/3-mercaptopyruvate sulfurtransferase